MFVEVPITVQVPPKIEANATGINIFEGLSLSFLHILTTGATYIAVTVVLFMKAEVKLTVDMMYVGNHRIRLLGILMKLSPIISKTPAFCMAAPTTKIDASMIIKSLPNPLNASAGVRIPSEVNTMRRAMVIKSTENLSVAKSMIAINNKLKTNAISRAMDNVSNYLAKKQKSI